MKWNFQLNTIPMDTILKEFRDHLKHRLLCQAYLISYPKCGRTWLNSILLHYVLRHYRGLSRPLDFEFGHSMVKETWCRRFPNVCFTHDISSQIIPHEEYADRFDPSNYITKRSMLLVRDPRDVVVSYYYHAKKKTDKNRLPAGMSLRDFMYHEAYGIRSIIAFFNLWPPLIRSHESVSWCKYEELYARTMKTVEDILVFFGAESVSAEALEWAIEQTKFNSLQKRELEKRTLEGNPTHEKDLRTRKGIIGGYREEMGVADIDYADKIIKEELDPLFGYS